MEISHGKLEKQEKSREMTGRSVKSPYSILAQKCKSTTEIKTGRDGGLGSHSPSKESLENNGHTG